MRVTRREFVKASAATVALGSLARADEKPIRIGIVGCGGRGTGAVHDCISSSNGVELVAMGDLFENRMTGSRKWLASKNIKVADDKCFVGWDAYKQVIASDIDLVLLATPPGYRPMHIEHAVEAGKHVFAEKPVAVDPPGVRRVIAAGEKAKAKGLAIVSGTMYRHHPKFIETTKSIHDGGIGKIMAGRVYYNSSGVWYRPRKEGMSDMEYQARNWYYFQWACGDQIVEQHVHTLDVMKWAMGANPVRCVATGGRASRLGEKYGNVYDSFAVDYEFPDGVHVMSMSRHWKACANYVGAKFVGSKGEASPYRGTCGDWEFSGKVRNAYVQEHDDLIASIRSGRPLNEARQVAESTMVAIMGREAAYTGAVVTWDEMMKSDLDLTPPKYEFGPLRVRPLPVPGKHR